MTVTIRPVPSRVAGNRIVPFGRVQYTYKPNPVGLRDWKPPVPEPLKPAPLLGLGTLALLGLQALAWWWGQLNSRPETREEVPPVTGMQISGTVPPPGNTTTGTLTFVLSSGTYSDHTPNCQGLNTYAVSGATFQRTDVRSISFRNSGSGCNGSPLQIFMDLGIGTGNVVVSELFRTSGSGIASTSQGLSLSWNAPEAVPYQNPVNEYPLPNGFVWPEIEPQPETEPATLPAPLPLPLPSTVPQVEPSTEPDTLPAPSPLVPITPGPVAPPIIRPATPYSPQQPKVPAPIATNNGIVVAPAPVPVPTTPQDAIYPVPGGLPVTGRTMTPTIQAVAQEVGRIEQKIDRMLNPVEGQWGDATDRLQLLWTLLRDLFNALTDGAPAGKYELSSPCVVDGNGDRIIYETEWPEQGTNHGAILARVDAIAGLLQIHKDLKQPNCHIPPVEVGGEFVTVNFEQID